MPAEPAKDKKPLHLKRVQNPKAKCPRVSDAEMQELVDAAWDQGWWCEPGGNNHVKCYPPDGEQRIVPIPSTPSDWRTVRNKRAQLRRSGLRI